jgi:hypothetical protein
MIQATESLIFDLREKYTFVLVGWGGKVYEHTPPHQTRKKNSKKVAKYV